MTELRLQINGEERVVRDPEPDIPLLWVLRDHLGLLGTKFGCGEGGCGACTVLLDDKPVRACIYTAASAAGKRITTIEGLAAGGQLHPLQEVWIEQDVSQCGYCQAGQIMAAVALLARSAHPSDEEIDRALDRNICRCGTYERIRAAIHEGARRAENAGKSARRSGAAGEVRT